MKKLLLTIILASNFIVAQTTWDGPTMTFTKADNADPTLEANQDRITSNVWLTRGSKNVLFNIVSQTAAPNGGLNSPQDTEWAEGTTADISSLTFTDFKNAAPTGSDGKRKVLQMVGRDYVLHLVTDNVYIDLKMLSWSRRAQGAGFSYQRSTDPNLSIEDYDKPVLSVYPNPSTSFLRVNGLNAAEPYRLYSILGVEIQSGIVSIDQEIDIDALQTGMYMLQIANTALPFVKK